MIVKQGALTVKHGDKTATIGIISLGCAKNLVNTEQMMYLLKEAGYEVTGETIGADAVIINTCGFIESAKMEAIEAILELGRARDNGQIGKLVVTGCLAERYKGEIMAELPEIDGVVGVGSFDEIVDAIGAVLNSEEKHSRFGDIDSPISEAKRVITTSKSWAYIKIAEGCDNHCSFCIIPAIRGKFRSRPMENILEEAQELAGRGAKELILVAQDSTRYGLDLYGKQRLPELLTELCKIEPLRWIRLHYLYPDETNDEIIEAIAQNDKVLKYIDIPIQHISDSVLKKMNRRGTGKEVRTLISRIRDRIPGVVIRTSVIAGLPGESEKEFKELCEFLTSLKIERAGIFPYSPEEGTAAAQMQRPGPDVAVERAEMLADIQMRIIDEFNESRIGNIETVLVEGCEDGRYYGRSFAESPDVDGYITVFGDGVMPNEFFEVRITGVADGEPIGEVVL
ncbi:MAG: 30S ribosomal protein S12 methylthiotransferase RimO [Oscillospiraceae bacterium]|nr:30S ribosomal protein S12 methylthiotransferase RimO [Oscillospiraceae bacterium]